MAIVKVKAGSPTTGVVTTPEMIDEPTKSIFTEVVPEVSVASLLQYVEGYPWTVDLFCQYVNKDNTLENYDPSAPNLTVPYYSVNDCILNVSSPLSSSYDNSTGVTTISGSAIAPYGVKPNAGDIFIAKVDTGEDAIFMINSVTRKTHRKETLYDVNYNLVSYLSSDPQLLINIKKRVQDTYFYNKDFGIRSNQVMVQPSVKEAKDRLTKLLRESQQYYFDTFISDAEGGLYIPGTEDRLYDPVLIQFLSRTVDLSNYSDRPFTIETFGNNPYIVQRNFFTAFLERNVNAILRMNKTYGFVRSGALPNMARLGTVFHTGTAYVLYPTVPMTNQDIGTTPDAGVVCADLKYTKLKTTKNYSLAPLTVQTVNNNNATTPKNLLHELFIDDYYIVSKNFYDYLNDNTKFADISYMEFLMSKFIKQEAISKEDLVNAFENYHQFSLLHQFYLLPVLWVMTKINL